MPIEEDMMYYPSITAVQARCLYNGLNNISKALQFPIDDIPNFVAPNSSFELSCYDFIYNNRDVGKMRLNLKQCGITDSNVLYPTGSGIHRSDLLFRAFVLKFFQNSTISVGETDSSLFLGQLKRSASLETVVWLMFVAWFVLIVIVVCFLILQNRHRYSKIGNKENSDRL